jgi:hypothetical protein
MLSGSRALEKVFSRQPTESANALTSKIKGQIMKAAEGSQATVVIEVCWSTSGYLPAHGNGENYKTYFAAIKNSLANKNVKTVALYHEKSNEIWDRFSSEKMEVSVDKKAKDLKVPITETPGVPVASNRSHKLANPSRLGAFEVHLVQTCYDARVLCYGPDSGSHGHGGTMAHGAMLGPEKQGDEIMCMACASEARDGEKKRPNAKIDMDIPQHTLLHSKLWSRRWPNVQSLLGTIGAILIPPKPNKRPPIHGIVLLDEPCCSTAVIPLPKLQKPTEWRLLSEEESFAIVQSSTVEQNTQLARADGIVDLAGNSSRATWATDPDSEKKLWEVFQRLDTDGDGVVNKREIVKACRGNSDIAKCLGLPMRIRQEDGSRDLMEYWFQSLDVDDSRELSWDEFRHLHRQSISKGYTSSAPDAKEITDEVKALHDEPDRGSFNSGTRTEDAPPVKLESQRRVDIVARYEELVVMHARQTEALKECCADFENQKSAAFQEAQEVFKSYCRTLVDEVGSKKADPNTVEAWSQAAQEAQQVNMERMRVWDSWQESADAWGDVPEAFLLRPDLREARPQTVDASKRLEAEWQGSFSRISQLSKIDQTAVEERLFHIVRDWQENLAEYHELLSDYDSSQ